MLVAVTGGTGFIGRNLVGKLTQSGLRVRVLVRRPERAALPPSAEIVAGPLDCEAAVRQLVRGADVVVHAAGAVRARRPAEFDSVNVRATDRLAALCAEAPSRPRLIHLSSLAAREPTLSPYAASKAAAERALAASGAGLDWMALRPPVVYGPGDRATLGLFASMKRGFLPIPGRRQQRFSMIHVDDLIAAVLALTATPRADRRIVEIHDGQEGGYDWREVAAAGAAHLGRRVLCIPIPRPVMRTAAVANVLQCQVTGREPLLYPGKVDELYHIDWVCRTNALTTLTNWRPVIGMAAGIAETLDWYSRHGWL